MHIYIIYCITNKINNKFYIGVHKTKDIDDKYMGSGILIKRAIEKHGVENFNKKILHIFTNEKAAFAKEKELVTESLVTNKLCYNLKEGGRGGFDHIWKKYNPNTYHASKSIKIYHPLTMVDKRVQEDKLSEFLNDGWLRGFSPIHKQKLSIGARAKIQTPEHRAKNSLRKKSRLIYIKHNKHKWVLPDEVDLLVQDGWIRLKRNCLYCNSLFEVDSMPNTLCSTECKRQRLNFMARNNRASSYLP
jgi:hypothetical protein